MGAASVPRFNRLIGRYGNEGRLLEPAYCSTKCQRGTNGDLAGARASSMPRRTGRRHLQHHDRRLRRAGGSGAARRGGDIHRDAAERRRSRADEFTLTAMLKLAAGLGDVTLSGSSTPAPSRPVQTPTATAPPPSLTPTPSASAALRRPSCRRPPAIVAWNTLIAGCVKNGLPSLPSICSTKWKASHAWAIKKEDLGRNPHVGAAVVDFYRHCGELSSAEAVHSASCRRNPFATASMVAASLAPAAWGMPGGLFDQVGELLRDACSSSSTLDESLFVNLLAACADQAELGRGKELHGRMVRAGFCPAEGRAGGALVDMYAQCGEIGGAARVFKRVPHKDLVHCNTMLAGLARHGRAARHRSSELFKAITAELRRRGNVHGGAVRLRARGAVDAGEAVFASMAEVHGVSPELGHYCCMVDLYGRAGRVKEALEMVGRLPFRPDAVLWGALLDACRRRHGGAAGAREVGEKLLAAAGGSDGARYVQVANAFAAGANGLSGAP
ncbi:unnamed protein product [Spirodela intermedia]|uniref:Uncharacterized protein n=1 Tax=Spirodela intermedia TaxID=51605 RepID=A0A7I8IMN0_SPIIN|nr:unnamed protein product [Spirodela intermedia]CAA6659205.1 unnamed protein product [Spirodela intermedia]